MNNKEFKQGDKLEFDCYGTKIIGRYIKYSEVGTIWIIVISDSSGVYEEGEEAQISKGFLVN